jgi:hypothetical protein
MLTVGSTISREVVGRLRWNKRENKGKPVNTGILSLCILAAIMD